MGNRGRTPARRLERIKAHAEDAFSDHELTVEAEDTASGWYAYQCRRPPDHPNAWPYHFRIVCGPNLIAVYGDIGDSMFCPGSGRCGRGFALTAAASVGYFLEKRPKGCTPPDVFFPHAVRGYLMGRLADVEAEPDIFEADTAQAYRDAIDEWERVGDEPDAGTRCYEMLDALEGDAFETVGQFYGPAESSVWGFHAVMAWRRLMQERGGYHG